MPNKIANAQLQSILPHAYPFILLDYVEDYVPGQSLTAIKNITVNEWPFSQADCPLNHYPETLLIEAAVQAALVLYAVSRSVPVEPAKVYIGKVLAEFLHEVRVGDQARIDVKADKITSRGGVISAEVRVDQARCAAVELVCGVVPEGA